MSAALCQAPPRDALTDGLFPDSVRALACRIDAAIDDLYREERAQIAQAIPKRQREFAAGRRAARELLAQIGVAPAALLRNVDRTVAWPTGVVGSISHCDDLCAVAVARGDELAGLGVDVEPDGPLAPELWSRICTPREIAATVDALLPADRGRGVRLLFSAKEAFYKSVYPTLHQVLGFHDVEIQLDWETSRFSCRVSASIEERLPARRPPVGRFVRRGGFVLTGATLDVTR